MYRLQFHFWKRMLGYNNSKKIIIKYIHPLNLINMFYHLDPNRGYITRTCRKQSLFYIPLCSWTTVVHLNIKILLAYGIHFSYLCDKNIRSNWISLFGAEGIDVLYITNNPICFEILHGVLRAKENVITCLMLVVTLSFLPDLIEY